MNEVLQPFLPRFVLVFFNDILIFSNTWADHLRYVRAILATLQQHRIFRKHSKCTFGVDSIAYLGHVISTAGIAMEAPKVQAMWDYPLPRSVLAICGFLRIAGYYRKFGLDYSSVACSRRGSYGPQRRLWLSMP